MKLSRELVPYEPVRLGDKVAAIIAALPPKIAAQIRRDTERMLRNSHDRRRQTWRRARDRRGRWSVGACR